MTAGCSSTPATEFVRCSLRRGLLSMPRSPRSAHSSCRYGWVSPPARPNCAGSDYFGAVLNRAARVMSAGHGGQILLDGATAELVSGVDLIDLGPRRLRDIAKAVEISSGSSCGPARRVPAAENARRDTGQPSAAGHQLRRAGTRSRRAADASQGPSIGDLDRRRRGRQDPTGAGSSRRAWYRDFPDGVWVIELARGRRPGRCARSGRRRARHHSTARVESRSPALRQHWKAGSGCWCSTTASMFSTRPPT